MIAFYNVDKQFGDHKVLDKATFNIEPGEMVVLNGTSGAGKSTVVNMLIGAEKPDDGTVEVDGFLVSEMTPDTLQSYRRNVGVVHQDYKLLPKKTIFENVAFAMEACEAAWDEIKARVPEVLEKVGLNAFMHHFPYQLSGGERQRVAIARALVHEPGFLIADEPTGNLDENNVRSIVELFRRLNDEGTTVLLTSHDPLVHNLINGRTLNLSFGKIT